MDLFPDHIHVGQIWSYAALSGAWKLDQIEPSIDQTIAELRAEIERLRAENEDLQLLYEATIEHGEAVEDQLAESNILLKETQERLEEELHDAARYIFSLLPEPRAADPATEWLLVPSTELGGDTFGYHELDRDHFAIYLLDVCGHGVGAALLSASVINVLRAATLPQADFRDPAAVLAGLNDAFPMEKQNNMFFTIWYGVYHRPTRKLSYASAGHPPGLLLRAEAGSELAKAFVLEGAGLAIGAFAGMAYDAHEIDTQPGDRLIVVSDGTFEVGGEAGNTLTFSDLEDVCRRSGGDRPQTVLDWARAKHGTETLPDDFTFLRVEF